MNPLKSFYNKHIAHGELGDHWTAYALTFIMGYWLGGGCASPTHAVQKADETYNPAVIEQKVDTTALETASLESPTPSVLEWKVEE